ncbi:hypothetical protein ACUNWD_03495 [Sunxiuqinia sp. A32]|uniref:hypothetical protein n=1 Tax=Sunxiuqinia sp. A32 TaxID=3461496 RepID=UPI0040467454
MKKLVTILLFVLSLGICKAQQPDSLKIESVTPGKIANIIDIQDLAAEGYNYWEQKFKGHWSGIHFGLNGLANTDYNMYTEDQEGFLDINLQRSTLLDINLIQISQGVQRNRNTIGLITGVGLQVQTFHLDQNTSIEEGQNRIEPVQLIFDANQKSKLSSTYLTIPLLVEFQIPIKTYTNRLYLATGIVGQKRLTTHTKIKYRKNNQKEKLKIPDDFHMHNIRYSAMFRVGYRWINLFASYDFRPLFIEDKGPEMYPFSFGVTLISL